MALQPFTWGANGQRATPSSVKKQAEIAAALAARGGAPQNLGEGLNRVGEALLANSYSSRAAAGEAEGAASRKALMDALMGNPDPTMADIAGALGNEWVASDPGSSAVLQALLGAEMQQNDPLRQLQIEKGQLELEALRNPPPPAPDYGFTFAPDGTLIRTDTISGTFDPMGSFPKPEEGPLVNIVNGDGAPGLGKLSPDYGYVLDPETRQPVIDPATGLPTAAPVPGSPAAIEAAAAAAKAETGAGRREVATDVVTTAASIARDLAAKPGNTGLTGAVWANLSETEAAEMRRQVDVLKATATIENLTAMRQASPTGGALGSVTEKEGAMLAAASGAIDPNSSGPDFQRQLDNYERTLLQIVHGPTEGERIFNETRKSASGAIDYNAAEPPPEWQGDPSLWRFMSPEDRALW